MRTFHFKLIVSLVLFLTCVTHWIDRVIFCVDEDSCSSRAMKEGSKSRLLVVSYSSRLVHAINEAMNRWFQRKVVKCTCSRFFLVILCPRVIRGKDLGHARLVLAVIALAWLRKKEENNLAV